MESRILSAILHDRSAYNEIKETLKEEDFSDQGRIILNHIIDYYHNDPEASNIDVEIITDSINRRYPEVSRGINGVLTSLRPVSIPNVLEEYIDVRLHSMAQRISMALTSGHNDDITELMSEYAFLRDKRQEALHTNEGGRVYVGAHLDDMFEGLSSESMVALYPQGLNDAVDGGVPAGSHIVVFARPEVGKSLFVINQAAETLKAGKTVLFVENEDPIKVTKQRFVSNLLGLDRQELLSMDKEEVKAAADNAGMENLILCDEFPGSVNNVRNLVKRHSPDLVVVNQIRNLATSKSLTKVEALEYVAQGMRNIAKEFDCVVISVTQAGDSATYKRQLDIGDVDFSNTGIPSTADLMIGISNVDNSDVNRDISLPKNKLSGTHQGMPICMDIKLSTVRNGWE